MGPNSPVSHDDNNPIKPVMYRINRPVSGKFEKQ